MNTPGTRRVLKLIKWVSRIGYATTAFVFIFGIWKHEYVVFLFVPLYLFAVAKAEQGIKSNDLHYGE